MPPPPRESQIGECARAPCRCDCDTGSLSRPLTWPKQAGDSWANAARQGGQARAQRAPAVRRVSESRPRPPTKFVPRLRAGKGSDVSVPAEKKSRGPPHQAPAPTTTPLKPSLAALALPSKGPCNVSLSNLALKARWKRSSLGREHLRRQDRDDHSRLIVRSRFLFLLPSLRHPPANITDKADGHTCHDRPDHNTAAYMGSGDWLGHWVLMVFKAPAPVDACCSSLLFV